MGLTHFPNGISTQASSAASSNAGAGAVSAADGSVFGETVTLLFSLASASTLQISAETWPIPFDGNVISASVVIGATVTVTTGHSFIIGSAGATAITVTPTSGVARAASFSSTVLSAAVTTADSIHVSRAAQGTAGNTWASITIAKT
jgi:hypothetical protein